MICVKTGKGDKKKHGSHLDDTDLIRLDHHFSKLCGDQDLTLLGDYRDIQTKVRQREENLQGEYGLGD